MSSRDAAFTYHHCAAVGASAVGQVVALYDTILRDFHRAAEAIDAGQIETRITATNHALLVIGELQGVLNFERGGEAARNLNDFYNVMRASITQASIASSREKLLDLIAKFARLRAAWVQVERSVAPSEPADRLRASSNAQAALSQAAALPTEGSENSRSGGWTA
ncbi:MAG TPA: flagellar protein FliS [Candidatus Acidoferrum sp.]|nr:flagellar protein FliS [Candidatus Acidoferrum sp.]